jgi:hypothetical protein
MWTGLGSATALITGENNVILQAENRKFLGVADGARHQFELTQ